VSICSVSLQVSHLCPACQNPMLHRPDISKLPFPGRVCRRWDPTVGTWVYARRQMAPRSVYLLLQGSRLWPTDRRKNRQTTERQDSWSNRVRLRIMHAMRPKIVTSLLHQLLVWRQCKQIWRMMPCFELNARSVSMVHFGTVSYHQTDSSWIHVIAHYDDYVTYTVCDNRLRLRYVG